MCYTIYSLDRGTRKEDVIYVGLVICIGMAFVNFLCPGQFWAPGCQACDQHTRATMLLHTSPQGPARRIHRNSFSSLRFTTVAKGGLRVASSSLAVSHWALILQVISSLISWIYWQFLCRRMYRYRSTTKFKMNMDATLNLWCKKNCDGFQRLVCSHLLDGLFMIPVIGFGGWLL